MQNGKPKFTYELYIAAPPAKVWKGLTDGDITQRYVYGTRLETLKPGAPYAYLGGGDIRVRAGNWLSFSYRRV